MKKVILSGLMVTVPLGITFYAIYFIYSSLNEATRWLPLPVFPGSGIIYILLFIYLVGFVSQWWVAKKGLALIEYIINKFPGIKTLYSMSKETLSSLAGDKRAFSQVVLYKEQEDVFRIGFLTSEDVTHFELGQEYIAVYFPHGLQISGDIRLLSRDKIVMIATPVEEALQFCLSAGVASQKGDMEVSAGR